MKTKPKIDNRGMTLVELLVAVVILGIIVVPLLHTIVTGATTERKSRVAGEATATAQDILETIEASDAE
ncbi:MAG: type II secretion system protein, partial [Oscillospiraceae bacterium]